MSSIKGYSTSDLVNRIVLTLPSKFNTISTNTNLYAFWSGICEALKLNTDYIDELYRQTNIVTSTSGYVDKYIAELSGLGRLSSTPTGNVSEVDSEYKERYDSVLFEYNCTKNGLQEIVIDLTGSKPLKMYNAVKRGAYLNDRYFYNNTNARPTYGVTNGGAYTGYIEFSQKPSSLIFSQLCKTLTACKAAGITVYLKYPS